MAQNGHESAGGKITLHPLPPAGFNSHAASPLELWRYGLPQRPDPAIRPQFAARWDDSFFAGSARVNYLQFQSRGITRNTNTIVTLIFYRRLQIAMQNISYNSNR